MMKILRFHWAKNIACVWKPSRAVFRSCENGDKTSSFARLHRQYKNEFDNLRLYSALFESNKTNWRLKFQIFWQNTTSASRQSHNLACQEVERLSKDRCNKSGFFAGDNISSCRNWCTKAKPEAKEQLWPPQTLLRNFYKRGSSQTSLPRRMLCQCYLAQHRRFSLWTDQEGKTLYKLVVSEFLALSFDQIYIRCAPSSSYYDHQDQSKVRPWLH